MLAACRRIGIEFIEEDRKFTFGKILKSNVARALQRSALTSLTIQGDRSADSPQEFHQIS